MASYAFTGRGAALPYQDPGSTMVLHREIDVADIVANNPGKLALAASPQTALSSFTGFVQNDILEVFEVPAGTAILMMGVRVQTQEGAACLIDVGCVSATQTMLNVAATSADPDSFGDALDLNTAANTQIPGQTVEVTDMNGIAGRALDCYVTDGSIDLTVMSSGGMGTAKFDIFFHVAKVF